MKPRLTLPDSTGRLKETQSPPPRPRSCLFVKFSVLIYRSLWCGATLTVLSIVAGVVWAILSAVNDRGGAAGARGVFLAIAACWLLNLVTLVTIIAICQLKQQESRERPTSNSPPPTTET